MKKFFSKTISVLLAILMLISAVPMSIYAAETEYSGQCGDNVYWVFDKSSRRLTISGTGDMYDYSQVSNPWPSYFYQGGVVANHPCFFILKMVLLQ